MKINCLSCGFKVDMDDAYDDYAGQIKCYSCRAIMQIKATDGKLTSVMLAEKVAIAPAPLPPESTDNPPRKGNRIPL